MNSDFGAGDEIGLERRGRAGLVTLRRPEALNALTHAMVRAIGGALDAWERDSSVSVVIIRGEGRAFCSGGDISAIYRAGLAGSPPFDFFADEYRLNARIRSYPKPYVALVDGIVMGGGVGVSVHSRHRVFTERARFAMPEVSIGFFPDVGGSFFLPRLPGRFGFWLGLTGSRIAWGDCLWAGIATAAVASGRLEELTEALCWSGDPAAVIRQFSEHPVPETGPAARRTIAELFSGDRLDMVIGRLTGDGGSIAAQALGAMRRHSPTSLHVAFRQLRAGATLAMEECLAMEYRIVNRMLAGHDFREGIRAAIIDRDNRPRWQPGTLEQIETGAIDAYFAPLGERELAFRVPAGG